MLGSLVNARVRPVGSVTRGTGLVRLATTQTSTDRVVIDFPRPTLITGLHAVVTPATFAAFSVDAKAILVTIDLREDSARVTGNSQAGASGGTVSLDSIDSLVRDHLLIVQPSARGSYAAGFTFSSRHAAGGVSGLTGDVLITVDAFGVTLTDDLAAALAADPFGVKGLVL